MMLAALRTFTTPNFDYVKLAPMLIVFTGAIIAVLVEAFIKRESRRGIQIVITLLTLAAAFAAVLNNYTAQRSGIEAEIGRAHV